MKNKKIIIGSRGSKLALIYAEKARAELLKNPEIESIEIKSITTTGDLITDVRLSEHGGKGLFCKKIEQEFLRKRKHLHDILWKMNYKIPMSYFANSEYDEDFDMILYKKIGYDKLNTAIAGLFITPYAATSLREYFATGFTDFYTHPHEHGFLQKVSPELYKKLFLLQNPEELDN